MAGATVKISGDESKLLQSLDRVEAKEKDLAKTIERVGDAGEKSGREVGDSMEKAGRKGVSEFDKLIRELRKTGPEGGKQARAIEAHLQEAGKQGRRSVGSIIDEIEKIDDEAAEAAREMARHLSQQSQVVEAKLVKMASPLDRMKAKAEEILGPKGIGKVTAYSAAIGGITAALFVASKGFEKFKEKQDEALSSLQSLSESEKRLAQIAKPGGNDLDSMIAQADKLSLQTGISREQTRNLIFSARSEGFEEDAGQIARFGSVVDVESQGALAGSLGRLFKDEGLNVEQRLSGVLAAAEQSAFDFETVGKSVKKSAAASSEAGADLAETLAANATLANLIGETAGDRLKNFASKVSLDKDLRGQGYADSVQSLQAMDEETRSKFLGDSIELNEAYSLLSKNLEEVKTITAAVRADIKASLQSQGVLSQRVSVAEGSERFASRKNVARSEIAKEIAAETRFAKGGAAIKAAENNLDASLDNFGVGTIQQYIATDLRASNFPILSSIPIVSQIAAGLTGDMSTSEAVAYGSQAVGIDPAMASNVFAGTVAGAGGAMGNVIDFNGPAFANQQNDNQANSPEMLQELRNIANNTAPARKQPPNYSTGQQAGATGAAAP